MVRAGTNMIFEVIQHTDVKTSKVIFSGEDESEIFWIGKQKGRCVSLWKRDRESETDPYKILSSKNVDFDPTDICVLGPKRICVGFSNGSVSILNTDMENIVAIRNIPSVHDECSTTVLARYEDSLLSASSNGSVEKINLETSASEKIISGQSGLKSMCTSLGNNLVITGSSTGQIGIWDIRDRNTNGLTLSPIHSLIPSKKALDSVTSICSHPAQSNLICCGTDSGIVGLIDLRNGQNSVVSSTYLVARKAITKVMFHPTASDNLICSSNDGSLLRIDASCVPTGQPNNLRNASKHNVWLSENGATSLRDEQLKPESVYPITSFDCRGDAIVSSISIGMISTIENLPFFPTSMGKY